MQSVVWNEALKINGADPDFHRRDLWNAIQAGDFPEWELGVQLFDQDFAEKFDFDVLDATKIIPEELVPVRIVGRMVLDRTVDNFFAETEQVAFCTQNIVPGIDFTNDPLLQGRNFSYLDTQLKRLGSPNFTYLPINAPKKPGQPLPAGRPHGDGQPQGPRQLRAEFLGGAAGGPREAPDIGFTSYPAEEQGAKLRIRPETFADHYSQARQFYISQTPVEQTHIADAFIFELSKVKTPAIRARMVSHLLNVDEGLADKVTDGPAAGGDAEAGRAARPTRTDLPASPALSILLNGPDSFKGRKVGVLVSDGVDIDLVKSLQGSHHRRGRHAGVRGADGRRRQGQRRHLDRGRREDQRRPVGRLR